MAVSVQITDRVGPICHHDLSLGPGSLLVVEVVVEESRGRRHPGKGIRISGELCNFVKLLLGWVTKATTPNA